MHPTSPLLLALDFDGTIAPIVERPSDARIDSNWADAIHEITLLPGVAVAIISGRDLEDLHQRTSPLRVYRAGSHGAECSDPDGRMLWGTECSPLALNERLAELLGEADFRLERKKCAIAVHYRHLVIDSARQSVLDEFRSWARSHKLEIVEGRNVVETRVPGWNKATALRLLARHTRARRVVFAGDDATDFAALSWAARHGQGVFVESEEREPPHDELIARVSGIGPLLTVVSREVSEQLQTAAPSN